ncbi:MAG: hypothetical protein MI747_23870 [Desulfobacterales bacterium]|nr:hypothetical protein [Desulfobacterales bacterium]
MTLQVDAFKQASQVGGNMQLSRDSNSLKTTGKTIFGKIATWFRTHLAGASEKRKNRAVMESFVQALRNSPDYGARYADLANRELARQLGAGTPLSARNVSNLFSQFDEIKHNEANEAELQRLLYTPSPDEMPFKTGPLPSPLEQIFSQAAKSANSELRGGDIDINALFTDIRDKALTQNKGADRPLNFRDIYTIAFNQSKALVEIKEALFAGIDQLEGIAEDPRDMETAKTQLKEMVKKNNNIKDMDYIQQLVQTKAACTALFQAIEGEENPADWLRAMDTFMGAYDEAFGAAFANKPEDKLIGAEDHIKFQIHVVEYALHSGNNGIASMETLYEKLTSDDFNSLRAALGSTALTPELFHPDDQAQRKISNGLKRPLELSCELAVSLGGDLGHSKDEIQEAMAGSGGFVPFGELPPHIRHLALDHGAIFSEPTLDDIQHALEKEVEQAQGQETTLLRGNSTANSLLTQFVKNNGEKFIASGMQTLREVLKQNLDTKATSREFMTRFLGGTKAEQARKKARDLPEPIHQLVRTLRENIPNEKSARNAISSTLLLRTLIPKLITIPAEALEKGQTVPPETLEKCKAVGNTLLAYANEKPEKIPLGTEFTDAFEAFWKTMGTN